MSDTAGNGTELPAEFVDLVTRRAQELGVDGQLAEDFVRAVLRRLPGDLARRADPDRAVEAILPVLVTVAESPGPMIAVSHRAPTLDADGPAVCTVQVHGPDRPFLLATVLSTLRDLDHGRLRELHPVIGVERDDHGRLTRILPARSAAHRESIVHVELDRALTEGQVDELSSELDAALTDLTAATDDYPAMRQRLTDLAARVADGSASPGTDRELREEVARLLDWLDEGNLVLLGMRAHDVHAGALQPRENEPGLGILRDPGAEPLERRDADELDRILSRQLLRVGRTATRSRVARRSPLAEMVVVERDDADEVTGLVRIVGLFTRGALAQPARSTPVLRRRLARLLEAEDVVAGSWDAARLTEVFEAIPRDELFGADPDDLRQMVVELFMGRQREEVRAVVRTDQATRTVSIVATVPRDRYEPAVRQAFTAHLVDLLTTRAGAPDVDVDVSLAEDHEVVVRFTVNLPEGSEVTVPTARELGAELRRITRSWADEVATALEERLGEADAHRLVTEVVGRFPHSYREATRPADAVDDILQIDHQQHDLDLRIVLGDDGRGRIKALVRDRLVLSGFIPLLEDLGLAVLDERPHDLTDDGATLHLHDFGVDGLPATCTEDDQLRVAETLRASWLGHTSSDSLHRLVLSAALTWRDVAVLRTYRRYRRQVGTAYTPSYVNDALAANPGVVRAVVDLFHARFDPDRAAPPEEVDAARDAALAACDDVARLDHDRILRDLVALIGATLRTNVHAQQVAGAVTQQGAGVIVLKLDPSAVPEAPSPVPHRELFVLGPDVEGIHLRGGPVARGGLRWSDRQDDVRTEVLGLMKAQVLKNAVIVPTGAKGGFVLRNPPEDRDELRAEVARQYEVFVEAMLSVTDDLDGDEVVPPPRVRRWDGDDPYLVVAADKGTATFSDRANAIALRRGFWLGDAFASGGSNGYDHKALGITARGAWVAVRRHLLELGVHPEHEPVDVVGVGDMSGDVFGNGLLSSRTLRLRAAFDHRDIFVDPDPDPEASFDERQRLFDLPGSTWQDYDRDLLSAGGIIVSRDAKSVSLTDEVRTVLQVDEDEVTPAELMRAILRAPVDLLWFGGIGTYVKDPDERHEDVGDRANDEIRVDADEVRARVIGEGANLSITQAGRIRYARRGGRIDQDAIHNVGGVDCSDHEVNVKILLQAARHEELIESEERDRLLEQVTDDVVDDVLRDVDLQVWRISRDVREGPDRLVDVELLLELLEQDNDLDRLVQTLPATGELRERREQGAGLTRPELATVLGSSKRRLTEELLATDLPDERSLQAVLTDYMPDLLVERFGDQLDRHRLRRELVATRVANELVDRMGATFPSRVAAEADFDEATVAAAWWVARDVTGVDAAWRRLEGLLGTVGPELQDEMAHELEVLLGSLTRRYTAEPGGIDVDTLVARDRDAVRAYARDLLELGSADQRHHRIIRAERLRDDLVPDDLAELLACSRDLTLGPDVAATLRALGGDPDQAPMVGDVLLHLVEVLGLDRLHRVLDRATTTTVWRRRLRRSLAADLRQLGARAAELALREETGDLLADGGTVARRFVRARREALDRARRTITGVEQDVQAGLDGVTVALRSLRTAVEEGAG